MTVLLPIVGRVQPYAWGGRDFIPQLLGHTPGEQPAAEYWLGDHPSAPAELLGADGARPLNEALASPLPFLLKVLDVRAMLSIQVHPTRAQAQAGFAREDAAGIARDAPQRNYKDRSDKPELMVALSPFYLLHGFAEPALIQARLEAYPELTPLAQTLASVGLKTAFARALDTSDSAVVAMQTALAQRFPGRAFEKNQIEFWYQRWLASEDPHARGLLSLFFFNLVMLPANAAIYQPAGLLHAYLEGQNIELMASSDNVLRAGLTPKHIDVNELLSVGHFAATDPADYVIEPVARSAFEAVFPTPFDQFDLSCLQGPAKGALEAQGPEVWLALAGECHVRAGSDQVSLSTGQAVLVQPGNTVEVHLEDASRVYRARGSASQTRT